jgi:hypothetical protein
MYRIIAGEIQSEYASETLAHHAYDLFCDDSLCNSDSDIYGCDVVLYHDDYRVRFYVGHIQEPYNLAHSD